MPFIRGKNGAKGRIRWRAGCRHCQAIDDFHAAREQWENLRGSGDAAGTKYAGGADSACGYYQLSDEEFRELHPMPKFRDFLIAMRHEDEEPEENTEEEEWPYG